MPETRAELIIRWADEIVLNSHPYGSLIKVAQLEYYADWNSVTESEQKIRDKMIEESSIAADNSAEIATYLDTLRQNIEYHLLNNGYINELDYVGKWILTEPGRLMKNLGGHIKYIEYEKKALLLI